MKGINSTSPRIRLPWSRPGAKVVRRTLGPARKAPAAVPAALPVQVAPFTELPEELKEIAAPPQEDRGAALEFALQIVLGLLLLAIFVLLALHILQDPQSFTEPAARFFSALRGFASGLAAPRFG